MHDLKAMAELGHKFASDLLLGTKEALMPMFLLCRGKDGNEIIGVPFKNEEEKRVMVINVALEVVEKGCEEWSFLSENWFAYRKVGEPLEPRPTDDPERREGLFCMVSNGKEVRLYSWEITRDADGKCASLTPIGEGVKEITSWVATAINKAQALHKRFPNSKVAKKLREQIEKECL